MPYGDGEKVFGRLVAYLPDGPVLGPLSHPISWNASVPFNDIGALELVYHPEAPNYEFLQLYGGEVAVELRVDQSDFWVEPPGCRFLNLRRHDETASRDEPTRFSMPNYGWLLRKVRQIDLSKFNSDGVRPYTNATPPWAMKDILTEAQARSNIPGLDHSSFAPLVASDGAGWIEGMTMSFEMGQDALSMLDAFSRQRLCDWNFFKRALNIYNPNTFLTQNVSSTVKLFDRYDVVTSPMEFTYEDMATRLLQQGDNGAALVVTDAKPFSPWGAWEESSTASGVSDPSELTRLAQKDLASKYDYKTEYTKEVIFRQNTPKPLIDFYPGNLITTNQSNAARVQQITITCDGPHKAVRGSLVLSNHPDVNRMVPRELRQQRWINSLIGGGGVGGSAATGGNGMFNFTRVAPSPPAPNAPAPAQVTGVVATNGPGFDSIGHPEAQILLSWNPVTTDATGAAMSPAYYQLMIQPTIYTSDRPIPMEVSSASTQAHVVVDNDGSWNYAVRAVSQQGVTGAYSATGTIAVTWPTTSPPTASAPSLFSLSNQVRVAWDGLDSTGAVPPAYVKYYCIERSTTSSSTGFGGLGALAAYGQGFDNRMHDTLNTGTVVWYRARFRDSAGNFGPYSSVVSTTVAGPSGSIPVGSLNANVLQDGTITTAQIGTSAVQGSQIGSYEVYNENLLTGRPSRNLVRDSSASTFQGAFRAQCSNSATNSATRCPWTWTASVGWSSVLSAGGEYDNRLVLINSGNKFLDATPGSTTQALPNLDYGYLVDPENGPLKMSFRQKIQSATWPAAGQGIKIQLFARFYTADGTAIGGTAQLLYDGPFQNVNTPSGGGTIDYAVVKNNVGFTLGGGTVPATNDAAFFLPYFRVTSTGMSGRAGVQVRITRPFIVQSNETI
jgi:hypothetical protein